MSTSFNRRTKIMVGISTAIIVGRYRRSWLVVSYVPGTYKIQDSPSRCSRLIVLGVRQVEKGEHHHHLESLFTSIASVYSYYLCDRMRFDDVCLIFIWETVKGGYTPRTFLPIGGLGKTSTRDAFPRAPTGSEFNSDALARRPQPMPSTPAFFFSGTLLVLVVPPRKRGHNNPPF